MENGREHATVALVASTPFIRLLTEAGPEAIAERNRALASLVQRYGLSESALGVEGARVPHDLTLELLHHSAWVLGTEAIALRATRMWKIGDHGIGDYLDSTSGTLRELLVATTEHSRLLHDGLSLTLEVSAETAILKCAFDEDVVPHRWYPEFTLGKIAAEVRRAFGQEARVGPEAVHFTHSAPSYFAEYHQVFGAPVEFDRGENALVFTRSALDVPIPTADPILNRLLKRQASGLLRAQPKRRSFLDRVRAVAEEELPRNSADQACVARRLAMSSATLRRRLEAHGSRYSVVVDELRRELAAKHLTESKLGVDEISLRTGFAQTTAFYRAFRRWFGCTPAEYRRARAHSSWPPPPISFAKSALPAVSHLAT